jgi:hypothetical protein
MLLTEREMSDPEKAGFLPYLSHLVPFGCVFWAKTPDSNQV